MELGEWLRQQLVDGAVSVRDRGPNTSRDFFNICCPFCQESKFHFGINRSLGWGHCFVCGKGGKFEKIYREMRKVVNLPPPPQQILFIDEGLDNRVKLYKDKYTLKTGVLDHTRWSREIVEYVRDKRKLNIERCIEFGLCRGFQVFPGDLDNKNHLREYACFELPECGMVCRRISDESTLPRWKSFLDKDTQRTTLMASSFVYKYRPKKVFIVEGLFDLIRLPVGTAMALGGSNFNNEKTESLISITEGFMPEVVLMLDRDVNNNKIQNFKLVLESFGYKCSIFPWDIVDKEIGDVDEFCVEKSEEELWDICEVITPDLQLEFS